MVMKALHRKPRVDPILFAFRVIAHIRIAHRRQFTGGVLGGVSGGALAVDDDLGPLVGQKSLR